MTTTLVSFLGKAPENGNYRDATYDFDGTRKTTKYFGLALAAHVKPDKLVMLGTAGSMWEVLIESLQPGAVQEDERLALIESAASNSVTQAQLDSIADMVSGKLGLPCRLKIIPYGRDDAEQVQILQIIAEEFAENDHAMLDLTHGFRHLPMLGLMSALYLETVRRVKIDGMYYGAHDMTDPQTGLTPVLRLDGLLRMADWLRALHSYDKDGDVSPFAPLLHQDGMAKEYTGVLEKVAFFERTFNIADARRQTATFIPHLNKNHATLTNLFRGELEKRLGWHREDRLSVIQKNLARFYLKGKDYPRAAIFAFEAWQSALVEKNGGNAIDYGARDEAATAFKKSGNCPDAYYQLKNLRNTLAHGSVPISRNESEKKKKEDEQTRQILKNPEKLTQALEQHIKAIP